MLEATRAADISEAQIARVDLGDLHREQGLRLVLTVITRVPIIIAWSTPGAALLISSLGGFTFAEAVKLPPRPAAAAVVGWTGWFGKLLDQVPQPLLQALLAGVLLPFVVSGATQFESAPLLAGVVVLTYFVGKRFFERYAVLAALITGSVRRSSWGSSARIAAGFASLSRCSPRRSSAFLPS